MFKNRIVAGVLLFVLTFTQVNALEISVKSKYDDALDYLEMTEVIDHRSDFNPRDFVNNAEFVTLTMRNAGFKASEMKRKSFPTPFQDVPANAWFAPYIFSAYENGLLEKGVYFEPEKMVTKYEALKFFFTLQGISAPIYAKTTQNFKDVPSKSKLSAVVSQALKMNLMKPEEKDFFGVMQKITKGEVALMLYEYALRDPSIVVVENSTTISDEIPNATILLDVWERIHQNYLFDEKIDDEKMVYAAIEGMVNALDDPFTVYMPPEEGSEFASSMEGELEGIGAYIGIEQSRILIISPIQGSPAQKAGLKPNDEIIEINGEDIKGKPLYEVVTKIKGPKDTEVKITVLRDGFEKKFTIIRAKIDLESVSLKMEDDIAIVSLNQFIADTDREFENVVSQIQTQNAKGIVLDLRNNPGGYLSVAVDVLGYFVEKGETVLNVQYPKVQFEQASQGNAELVDLPLVILVNEGSASAAEIVAGALQDLGKAKLVGKTTYGKGTVQELTYYTDDSSLKLTVAKWLTPKEKWVTGTGLKPDVEVKNVEGDSRDYQMERALQEVRSL